MSDFTSQKLFYFPLNIVLVDDNEDYLNQVSGRIEYHNVTIFNKAENALQFIKCIAINLIDFLREYLTCLAIEKNLA